MGIPEGKTPGCHRALLRATAMPVRERESWNAQFLGGGNVVEKEGLRVEERREKEKLCGETGEGWDLCFWSLGYGHDSIVLDFVVECLVVELQDPGGLALVPVGPGEDTGDGLLFNQGLGPFLDLLEGKPVLQLSVNFPVLRKRRSLGPSS